MCDAPVLDVYDLSRGLTSTSSRGLECRMNVFPEVLEVCTG